MNIVIRCKRCGVLQDIRFMHYNNQVGWLCDHRQSCSIRLYNEKREKTGCEKVKERDLYKKALLKWGTDAQIQMTIEECAELIVVLAKANRNINGSTYEEITEELADVLIMIKQMELLFPNLEKVKEIKLKKLGELLCHI